MPQCFVSSCSNYYGKTRGQVKVMYHIFPTKTELVAKWSVLCGYRKDFKPPPYARVCSEHFTPNCYQRDLQHELLGLPLRRKLKADAVPNRNLPNQTNNTQKQLDKKRKDSMTKQPFGIISGNKSKKSMCPIGGQMTIKQFKTHMENMSNGNTKPKTKFKPVLSKSPIRISINDLCRNRVNAQRRSVPLKESTVNKMERNLTKEVTIEPIKKITKTMSVESIKKLTEQVTIRPVFPKKSEKTVKISPKIKDKTNETRNDEIEVIPIESSQTNTSCDLTKASDNEKSVKNDPWLSRSRRERRPMRSSIRIAKMKSIESLSESFTMKVNSKKGDQECNKRERFSDKLKFMALLQLRYMRNKSDVGQYLEQEPDELLGSSKSLSKMQIMEDVREGCNTQPSSPGHADQRSIETEVKPEVETENGFEQRNSNEAGADKDETKDEVKEIHDSADGEAVETKEEHAEENYSNASSPNAESNKRKLDTEELPVKRLRSEIHDNFISRDKILNEFIEIADCNNLEQIHSFSEQLLAEVRTLNELAKEKEREWNNIIHLKKLKEELLLRMQRKRQLLILNEKSDYMECFNESQNENFEDRQKNNYPQSILKMNLTSKASLRIPNVNINGERGKHRNLIPKMSQNHLDINGSIDYRNKQRPTLDVQSIIADYRQRHPETVPRRGRRIRPNSDGTRGNILNFASVTLGSGSQVRHNIPMGDISNELGHLLNTVSMNGTDSIKLPHADSCNAGEHDSVSFKDMLQQFAKLSQSERNELLQNAIKPPPPYPEVTVHPVPTTTAAPTNSLLHGILTKTPTKQSSKTSFSPTLARLLTAPERTPVQPHATSSPLLPNSTTIHPSNMSISEILSTSKARNEITITPVDAQYETNPAKGRPNHEEDETEDSADRLVIDESNEVIDARKSTNTDSNSDTGDEIPQCQGCNQKAAQFVCAGCGNQWYCSRDCQVSAWDEHSEVCSG